MQTGFFMLGQCVVINEIMVNGAGGNDGNNSPETAEWVEFYNTCDIAIDLSCYIISDGDFSVTFPQGTSISPGGYLTFGSVNAGFAVDVNWGTCGCASGSGVGIFTNGDEQLIFSDPSGAIQEAVIWGNGQLPVNISSAATQGCASIPFFLNNSNTTFTIVPATSANDGCSIALSCDGGSNWQVMCGNLVTPGESNSNIITVVDFESTAQTICTGDCIDFNDMSTPIPTGWNWQFEGATTSSSPNQNPTQICYDLVGDYDVSLEISDACGIHSIVFPEYIQVQDNEVPLIIALDDTIFCESESVILSSSGLGPYNWLLDGQTIAGANAQQYEASSSGTYSTTTNSNICPATSNAISVLVQEFIDVNILPENDVTACGSSFIIEANSNGSIQWYQNDEMIPGANSAILEVSSEGNYAFYSEQAGYCPGYSDEINVSLNNNIDVAIEASKDTACLGEIVELNAIGIYESLLWFNGSSDPTTTVSNSGLYSLVATSGDCNADTSITIIFIDLPEVNAGLDVSSNCAGTIKFAGFGEGTLSWFENDVLIGENDTLLIDAPLSAMTLTLQAEIQGCISTDDVQVEADCTSLYIPNSFSPNNDGVNDIFQAEARGIKVYELIIFNRWGDVVFRSIDPEDAWTGGKIDYYVPDGVYTYLVKALDANNNSIISSKHSRGVITVIR